MIEFTRQSSGLYLATDQPATARVAFLFQDQSRNDPTFTLDSSSWTSAASKGYIAFFAPSATRDWNNFAGTIRNTFTSNSGSQIGWFPEAPLTLQPNLIFVSGQGTAQPMLSQTFQLKFRQSVTYLAQPDFFTTTVLFDDATNSLTINNPDQNTNVFQLSATPAGGATVTFPTTAPVTLLAMTGSFIGTASCVFPLTPQGLTAFEAGMMYFVPPKDGSLVGALSYPVFRGVGGSNNPFVMNVTLDMLALLSIRCALFFQFTDPLIGCNYVTANGKSFAFTTVNGDPGRRLKPPGIRHLAVAIGHRRQVLLSDARRPVRIHARRRRVAGHPGRNADAVRHHRHRVPGRRPRQRARQPLFLAEPARLAHRQWRFGNQARLSGFDRDHLLRPDRRTSKRAPTYVSQPQGAPRSTRRAPARRPNSTVPRSTPDLHRLCARFPAARFLGRAANRAADAACALFGHPVRDQPQPRPGRVPRHGVERAQSQARQRLPDPAASCRHRRAQGPQHAGRRRAAAGNGPAGHDRRAQRQSPGVGRAADGDQRRGCMRRHPRIPRPRPLDPQGRPAETISSPVTSAPTRTRHRTRSIRRRCCSPSVATS